MKRVAYIVPPYQGHYGVLLPLWKQDESSHLYVLRFQNDPQIEEERERITVLTLLQDRKTENAKEFNGIRSHLLENVLRCFLHDFNPTQVVYDFFCLEAREACRHLGIPAICSIPATLKADETKTCSDALLKEEHLYWLWKHPYDVSIAPVVFLGPRDRGEGVAQPAVSEEIWVSFGTVVPRYEGSQEKLDFFLQGLQKYAETHRDQQFVLYNVCFDRQFDNLANVRLVVGKVDLVQEFQAYVPKVLIFHGGGNTYTEAIHYRVPNMLVVPFFGDQYETARRVGNTYTGDLTNDLKNLRPMDYSDIGPLGIPFTDTFSDYFKPGDLVFGQRRNRDALQANFPHLNLHLNHYKPFTDIADPEQGDLPAIADVYNDSFGKIDIKDGKTEFHRRMWYFENRARQRKFDPQMPDDHKLVYHCLDLMLFTVTEWNGKIHFVLGDEPGPATTLELETIRCIWDVLKDSVIFYTVDGKRTHAPFFMKNRKIRDPRDGVRIGSGRQKSASSKLTKTKDRNLPIVDKYASRWGYITSFDPPHGWDIHVATCDLRIHYYYKIGGTEMQFWPWIYYHNFREDVKRGDPNYSGRDRQRKAQDALEGV